jgi:hypothetical protein
LRDTDVAALADLPVATYVREGESRRITAVDFVHDFQQGVARLAPRDAASLQGQIEDIVIAEHDLGEAKRLGLEQMPQFLEDRRGFALIQALGLYEQEVLLPRLAISPDDLRAYYEANRARYATPAEVTGVLFVFSDLVAARRSLEPGASLAPDQVLDPFVLRRDAPLPLDNVPYAFLASAPAGGRYGPFSYGSRHAVWLKRGTGERVPRRFEQVEAEVRQHLQREKMDELELRHFAERAGHLQLLVDPSSYGLPVLPTPVVVNSAP